MTTMTTAAAAAAAAFYDDDRTLASLAARLRARPKSRFIRQRVQKAGLLSQRDLD